jgi:hypothetical protein
LESAVWSRAIIGVVVCVVGAVWLAQGTNALHGSYMSGRPLYAVFGAILFVGGVALLAWTWRLRKRRAP